jgi:hypothetical protein
MEKYREFKHDLCSLALEVEETSFCFCSWTFHLQLGQKPTKAAYDAGKYAYISCSVEGFRVDLPW